MISSPHTIYSFVCLVFLGIAVRQSTAQVDRARQNRAVSTNSRSATLADLRREREAKQQKLLAQLRQKIAAQSGQLNAAEQRLSKALEAQGALRKQIQQYQVRLQTLSNTVKQQAQRIAQQANQLRKHEQEIQRQGKDVNRQAGVISKLRQQVDYQDKRIRALHLPSWERYGSGNLMKNTHPCVIARSRQTNGHETILQNRHKTMNYHLSFTTVFLC